MTIRTVTLSTGFDEVVHTRHGSSDAGQITAWQRQASGKGVNCARACREDQADVVVYALIGEREQVEFSRELVAQGMRVRTVTLPEATRRNLTIIDDGAGSSRHYRAESWAQLDPERIEELRQLLLREIQPGDIVSLHGALPNGSPRNTWTRFGTGAIEAGAYVAADIYGEPLAELHRVVPLILCKPNLREALDFLCAVGDAGVLTVGAALRRLAEHGGRHSFVSCGSRGIAFLEGDLVLTALVAVASARMEVGAGDVAMAAALCLLSADLVSGDRDLAVAMAVRAAKHVTQVDGVGSVIVQPWPHDVSLVEDGLG